MIFVRKNEDETDWKEAIDLTEEDYDALLEYEDVRKSGIMNMWLYMGMMSKGEVSGSKELANRIPKPGFYTDFLNSLKD